jgi:hypothetical protein
MRFTHVLITFYKNPPYSFNSFPPGSLNLKSQVTSFRARLRPAPALPRRNRPYLAIRRTPSPYARLGSQPPPRQELYLQQQDPAAGSSSSTSSSRSNPPPPGPAAAPAQHIGLLIRSSTARLYCSREWKACSCARLPACRPPACALLTPACRTPACLLQLLSSSLQPVLLSSTCSLQVLNKQNNAAACSMCS